MLSTEELRRRLARLEAEIARLRADLGDETPPIDDREATEAFLAKCHGFRDDKTADDLIKELREARVNAGRVPSWSGESIP